MIGKVYFSIIGILILFSVYKVLLFYSSSYEFIIILFLVGIAVSAFFWGSTRHHITEDDLKKIEKQEIKLAKAKKIFKEMLDL